MTKDQKDNHNQQDPKNGKVNIQDPDSDSSEIPFNSELEDSEENEEETMREDDSLMDSDLDDTERKPLKDIRKNDSM